MIAFVYSVVVALPPRSRVRVVPARIVPRHAASIRLPTSSYPMCRSIMTPLSSSAVGFARFLPAMSGAVPCTASNTLAASPMFPEGVSPSPPMSPAPRSLAMSPYRLGITITSNASGRLAICARKNA